MPVEIQLSSVCSVSFKAEVSQPETSSLKLSAARPTIFNVWVKAVRTKNENYATLASRQMDDYFNTPSNYGPIKVGWIIFACWAKKSIKNQLLWIDSSDIIFWCRYCYLYSRGVNFAILSKFFKLYSYKNYKDEKNWVETIFTEKFHCHWCFSADATILSHYRTHYTAITVSF